jgi:hypothetical protein
LRFSHSVSPIITQRASGTTKAQSSFITVVGIQIIDSGGNVIVSEIGQDHYRLDIQDGYGIDIENAKEISLKNASIDATRKLIGEAKFAIGEYTVTSANASTFAIRGYSPRRNAQLIYKVIRPLSVRVDGKLTVWHLKLGDGATPPSATDSGTVFSYSVLESQVRTGDVVVISSVPKNGQQQIDECVTPYVAAGSSVADYVLPIVEQAIYSNQKFQAWLPFPDFYTGVNSLLESGKFRLRLSPSIDAPLCVRPGYLVRIDASGCQAGECSSEITIAATVIIQNDVERLANYVMAEKVSLSHIDQTSTQELLGYTAVELFLKNLPNLIYKINIDNRRYIQ